MKINFGGVLENIVTREEFPLERAKQTVGGRRIVVLGYGSQGPGQSQNLRDNGFKVIVGQRMGTKTWDKAIGDGWVPGKTLFDVYDAIRNAGNGGIVSNLLSDAAQMLTADRVYALMERGQTAYFSHGFGPHFSNLTGIHIPDGVNCIMVAPKGAGFSVRKNFLNGSGINSSYAVQANATGDAENLALAVGMGIGSGFLFPTTAMREVVSDHFGERAILLGGTHGLVEAFNDRYVAEGKSAVTAFIDSSEQFTQVILPMIGRDGIESLYKEAESRGELHTLNRYREKLSSGLVNILNGLYTSCKNGTEAKIALDKNKLDGYREGLSLELTGIRNREMWKTGDSVRGGGSRDYSSYPINFKLAGAVLGFIDAQYAALINNGHSPSEAFNETVEELTQSLNQFYQEKGVAHLLEVCSTTAQRGALDWGPRFKKEIGGILAEERPLYVTPYVPDNSLWEVGKEVRKLRPENQKK